MIPVVTLDVKVLVDNLVVGAWHFSLATVWGGTLDLDMADLVKTAKELQSSLDGLSGCLSVYSPQDTANEEV